LKKECGRVLPSVDGLSVVDGTTNPEFARAEQQLIAVAMALNRARQSCFEPQEATHLEETT
jgi:hypothetical protein